MHMDKYTSILESKVELSLKQNNLVYVVQNDLKMEY